MRIEGDSPMLETKQTRKKRSSLQDVWYRFIQKKLALLGLVLLSVILIISILGSLLLDYEGTVISQNIDNMLQSPSFRYIFGTDGFGRDIFARIAWGSKYSLIIGFVSTGIALLFGAGIGAISGYTGGKLDNILMRIMDIFIAIPTTLLAIAIVSALGPGFKNLIAAIAIANVPGFARLTRSSVLTIKDSEFVEASRAVGSGRVHIMFTHILPNALAPLIVQFTLGVGWAITSAAGLSFLGLGITPPTPEWGNMLSEGREFIRYKPHLVIFPGLFIMLTVLALNLIGDGLRDAIDPKLKN